MGNDRSLLREGSTTRQLTDLTIGQRLKPGIEPETISHEHELVTRARSIITNPHQAKIGYMPIVELVEGRISAFEALADFGPAGAGEESLSWVELAAGAGLIEGFDQVAFRQAVSDHCQQRAFLQLKGHNPDKIRITVNLHPLTLAQKGCAERLSDIVAMRQLRPESVILEITEHGPLTDEAIRQAWLANEFGFAIYLDDFGEGTSRWDDLARLPVRGVKFGMVSTTNRGAWKHAKLRSTISEIKRQHPNAAIVAEGTEYGCQSEVLFDLGATHGQGYHFGRKCTVEESIAHLERRNALLFW